jgi:hypothetical protein
MEIVPRFDRAKTPHAGCITSVLWLAEMSQLEDGSLPLPCSPGPWPRDCRETRTNGLQCTTRKALTRKRKCPGDEHAIGTAFPFASGQLNLVMRLYPSMPAPRAWRPRAGHVPLPAIIPVSRGEKLSGSPGTEPAPIPLENRAPTAENEPGSALRAAPGTDSTSQPRKNSTTARARWLPGPSILVGGRDGR